MKKLCVSLLILLIFFLSNSSFSQSSITRVNVQTVVGTTTQDPSIAAQFYITNKLFAHVQDGGIGGFSAADQWSSLGRIQGASQTLYGFRVQRAGRALSMGFNGALQTGTPTLGTPFIEWGGNSGISVTPGDLQFRSFTNPTSATPVIRYTIRGADGRGLFGATSSGVFATPFFEINGATATGLGVNSTNFLLPLCMV